MVATIKNYAVKSDHVYVPSTSVSTNKALEGNLTAVLAGLFGKLYVEEPANASVGNLWMDGTTLKYCSADDPSVVWTTVISGSSSGHFYTGTLDSTYTTYEAAAAHVFTANNASVGDIAIISDDATTPTYYESFIMVGGTSSAPVIAHTTAEAASEVSYATPSGRTDAYIGNAGTVDMALSILDNAIDDHVNETTGAHEASAISTDYSTAAAAGDVKLAATTVESAIAEIVDWSQFKLEASSAAASGTTVPFAKGAYPALRDGVLRIKAFVSEGTGKYSSGIFTIVCADGALVQDSLLLTNYYASATSAFDVTNLTFGVTSGALTVTTNDDSTGAVTITVKVEWM